MTPCAELSFGRGTRSATQYRRPAEGRATLWPGASARREGRDGAEGDDDREGQRRGGQGLQPPAPVTDPFAAAAPRDEPPAGRDDGARERDASDDVAGHRRVTYPLGVTASSTPAGPYRGGHGDREVRFVKVTRTVIREPL